MDLEVTDLSSVKVYHRILILTGNNLSTSEKQSFITDAHNNNINYLIVENDEDRERIGVDAEVDGSIRYYAVVKGEVVGMETGHRTGDAIKVLCQFGFVRDELGGGL